MNEHETFATVTFVILIVRHNLVFDVYVDKKQEQEEEHNNDLLYYVIHLNVNQPYHTNHKTL